MPRDSIKHCMSLECCCLYYYCLCFWGRLEDGTHQLICAADQFQFCLYQRCACPTRCNDSPYSMYWQMRAEIEEKRPGTMKQQFRAASIDVASGTIGGNLVAYFVIITTASTLFVHHQSIQTAADAASSLGPLVGPFAKYLFATGLIGAALIAIPIMSASSAYAVADTFGWPAGLSEQPWQAEGFYIVLTASLLVGLVFALLRVDPIKLSFYANVFTGVLAPIMVMYLMVIGNSGKIMGEHKLGWLTNFFLAVTALVLIAGSVLFFYGLATGQGGS